MLNNLSSLAKSLPPLMIFFILVVFGVGFLVWKMYNVWIAKKHEKDLKEMEFRHKESIETKKCDKHDTEITAIKINVASIETKLDTHIEYQKEHNESTRQEIGEVKSTLTSLDNKIANLTILLQHNGETKKKSPAY